MTSAAFHTTLVARATAPGRGAVAMVRLSGPQAADIARAMTGGRPLAAPRVLSRVLITDDDRTLDESLWVYFKAPASFTGEDVVEFHLHGNPLLAEAVVALAIRHGAVAAKPGEFTRRAVALGKLSLTQAEGLAALIDAPGPAAMQQAVAQLRGALSERFSALENSLLGLLAAYEAAQDYPEEGVESLSQPVGLAQLEPLLTQIRGLLATHPAHQALHRLPPVALVGRPNAGKSSLFNRLLGSERAIISPTPGTTRDVLTATLNIGGSLVELRDTAGLRQSTDTIEQEGIRRALETARTAELCLLLLDLSLTAEEHQKDQRLLKEAGVENLLLVGNKMDLCPTLPPGLDAAISCKTAEGLEPLLLMLAGRLQPREAPAGEVAVNQRHAQNLQNALDSLEQARALLARQAPGEVVADWLWAALREIQMVEGENVTEKMLDEMFSRFCLGK